MDRIPSKEEVQKFLDASDDLMKLGLDFSQNIDAAFLEFKQRLETLMKTNFVEKAVVEMLAQSFSRMEAKVRTNLDNIVAIYQEGGQWYSFYLSQAMRRNANVSEVWQDKNSPPTSRERESP